MASMTSAAPTHSDSNKLERETVLRDALAGAQAISDDGSRAFALAALAPHQPETLLPKLLRAQKSDEAYQNWSHELRDKAYVEYHIDKK